MLPGGFGRSTLCLKTTQLANQLDTPAADRRAKINAMARKSARIRMSRSAVVGLGASAGGVAPLQQFFGDMNPESGLAFVVVMHLSPEYESQLASVLQQKTTMPVMQVSEPVKVRPNHVYVIPPNHQLTFEDSTLHLRSAATGARPAGDDRSFFPHPGAGLRAARGLRHHVGHGFGWCDRVETHSRARRPDDRRRTRRKRNTTACRRPRSAPGWWTGCCRWRRWRRSCSSLSRNEKRMKLPPEIPEADEPDAKVEDAPGGETVSEETRDRRGRRGDRRGAGRCARPDRARFHPLQARDGACAGSRAGCRSIRSRRIPQYLEFIRTHAAECARFSRICSSA